MDYINAKKALGQHFLKDRNIAQKIVGCLQMEKCSAVLEIGPGMGILTGFLMERNGIELKVIEIDPESINYLRVHFPGLGNSIIEGDFLSTDFRFLFDKPFLIIGNFPYNISSQIFFRILTFRDQIPEVVCMIQKEVAQRISAPSGNKTYGILSVLLQTFYRIEYLFTVGEQVFSPPPKVKSAVIRLTRNERQHLDCDESLFIQVVRTAFNQRRKILSNSLKLLVENCCPGLPGIPGKVIPGHLSGKRAEQLDVEDFIKLTKIIQEKG
jgi:16S rRNA (adenine1518-N6/adenine1519-N6)-dimethyltransferase